MREAFYQAVERAIPAAADRPFEAVIQAPKTKCLMLTRGLIALLLTVLMIGLAAAGIARTLTAKDIRQQWENENGPMTDWTLEEKATFAEEAQNIDPIWENAPYRTEHLGEITKEAARRIAVSALNDKYGLTEEMLSMFAYQESLTYLDADFPEDGCYYEFTWINRTETAMDPGGDIYLVQVDPKTGEILTIQSMEDLVG